MKRFVIILLLFCLTFSCSTIFAQTSVDITAELDINDFCVDVSVNGLSPFSEISIYVVPAQTEINSALTLNCGVYAEQTIVKSDGNLIRHIGFLAGASKGEYVVIIADKLANKLYISDPFSYCTEADMLNAIAAINSATEQNIVSVIEAQKDSLFLDTTEYDSMQDKETAALMFLNQRPAGGFTKTAEIHTAFGASVATVSLKTADNPLQLLRKYENELGIDISALDKCTVGERTSALEIMQASTYNSPLDLTNAYPGAVFAGKVNEASIAGDIREYFLSVYSSELTLNLTSYYKLSNPMQVFVSLMQQQITGFKDAESKFNAAVEKQLAYESSNSNQSSGSSVGGSPAPVTNPNGSQTMPGLSLYTDIDSVPWAESSINYLTEKGVVKGDGNGLFRPNDMVTRAEFVKMLVLAFDLPTESNITYSFSDVKTDAWYAPYVSAAFGTGIVKGISDNIFAPDINIYRQDLALMCSRAVKYTGMKLAATNEASPLDYNLIDDYALNAVKEFYSYGIINGDTDGNFRPKDGATRAEVAKIIAELMKRKGEA